MCDKIYRIECDSKIRYAYLDANDFFLLLEGDLFGALKKTNTLIPSKESKILTPISPTKIIGVGGNFPGQVRPSAQIPSVFLMPNSATVHHGGTVVLPRAFQSVLVEGELGVVIGKKAKQVGEREIAKYILGYTIVNDLSGDQSTLDYVPPLLKKGSDGFLPVGPCLLRTSSILDFTIQTTINGRNIQVGTTTDARFGIGKVISFLSEYITLYPGDIIAMGTPGAKPEALRGDYVEISIDRIGTLGTKIR
jgi:2-keto-4-pentenoate hydratase/2-oxohepta-3-ene-1,7-dioic acid hydratase in catechol pathway